MLQPAAVRTLCQGEFQVTKYGLIATPYCGDEEIARVANSYGWHREAATVRTNPLSKVYICQHWATIGDSNRLALDPYPAAAAGTKAASFTTKAKLKTDGALRPWTILRASGRARASARRSYSRCSSRRSKARAGRIIQRWQRGIRIISGRSWITRQGPKVLASACAATHRVSLISYWGLTGTATAAHFHGPAREGENAGVMITISPFPSPMKGAAILTEDQSAALLSGNMYINVHTAKYPEGEIRGQLTPAS